MQRAKRLIDETGLPMTVIAIRAGFGSLRRFNSVFAEVYGRPPTKIRRTRRSAGKAEQTVEDVTKKKALFGPRARLDAGRGSILDAEAHKARPGPGFALEP